MKRYLLTMVVFMATISVFAQEENEVVVLKDSTISTAAIFRFGCISYEKALTSMPEFAKAEEDLAALKVKYDAEMKTSEQEFNSKYEIFLSEQDTYAPSIRRKRQSELEDMMKRNEQFRQESIRLLEQAREDLQRPVRQRLDAVISDCAKQSGLAFVLNTDADAVPYLNAKMAFDITDEVISKLK